MRGLPDVLNGQGQDLPGDLPRGNPQISREDLGGTPLGRTETAGGEMQALRKGVQGENIGIYADMLRSDGCDTKACPICSVLELLRGKFVS